MQLMDALTRMSCLNHVAKVKIQVNWWSKMTDATKEDEKTMRTLQAEKVGKAKSLAFYKQRK